MLIGLPFRHSSKDLFAAFSVPLVVRNQDCWAFLLSLILVTALMKKIRPINE